MDDHESIVYQFIDIGPDTVTIKFKSEFNHGSFGEDKTTIDKESIKILYRQ